MYAAWAFVEASYSIRMLPIELYGPVIDDYECVLGCLSSFQSPRIHSQVRSTVPTLTSEPPSISTGTAGADSFIGSTMRAGIRWDAPWVAPCTLGCRLSPFS